MSTIPATEARPVASESIHPSAEGGQSRHLVDEKEQGGARPNQISASTTLAGSPNSSYETPKPARQASTRLHAPDTTSTAQSRPSLFSRITDGAHRKAFIRIPFLHRPLEESNGPWLEEEQRGEEWISLFYDLAVVAVLTIFSSGHELNSPIAIPLFFSYFVIINWIWVSQTHYDVRFQADDGFHRFFKSVQIMSFVYIGAASGNWNPALIRNDEASLAAQSSRSAAEARAANTSFQTVAIAFLVSRGCLAFQYIVCTLNGRRVKRRISGPLFSVISLAISCLFSIIAIVIPAHSWSEVVAKIAMFYLSILVELAGTWSQIRRGRYGHIRTAAIGDRYGAFTLIILGEGFISVTRAFNSALSGLSVSSGSTYFQVFLAITIIFILWCFLFARFKTEDEVRPRRIIIWEFIHFPLHFNLLLLLAAMVNSTDSSSNEAYIERYLDRLYLQPEYSTEMDILRTYSQEQNPSEDPTILAYQYLAQITLQVTDSYGLEVDDEMMDVLQEIYALNTTWSGNETLQEERQEEAIELVKQIITIPAEQALSGVLWLFPSAGLALILAACRSIAWYRFQGPAHWIVHSIQIGFGFALALLGLLDIGSRYINVLADTVAEELHGVNPMYWLVHTRIPLLIVALVYAIVYFGSFTVLKIVHRKKGNVWPDEEKVPETS